MSASSARPIRLAVCLACATVAFSCSGPVVTAVGNSNDLVIIHPSGQSAIGELMADVMQAKSTWLLGEPLFKPVLTTPGGARDLRNIRHVLLVGTWEDDDLSRLVRQAFVRSDEDAPPRLWVTDDVWAKRQVVGAVVARDADALRAFLNENGDAVVREFEMASLERLSANLSEISEESGHAAALRERFGWSVAPPSGYDFYTTDSEEGFVFFRRTSPDRSIFVYWTDGEEGLVSEQFVLGRREQLAARFYDGDEIEWKRPIDMERVEFLGRPAVRVSGWWANRTLVGGGPFRTYCFYEPTQKRVYLVDISLFAPSYDKTGFMRNLDAVAHTFTTAE